MKNYYFSINAGWGDTLWHLVNAILYCREHNKTLLLDLRGHWAGSKTHNCFHDYFQKIDYCNYETDISVINELYKFSEPHKSKNLLIKNSLASEMDSELFYQVFCSIIPISEINSRVNLFYKQHLENKYIIGVHSRTSNGEKHGRWDNFEKISIKDMFEKYKLAIDSIMFKGKKSPLKFFDNYCFFAASDSKSFLKLFEENYPNVHYTSRFYPKPGKGTGHEIGVETLNSDNEELDSYGRSNIAKEALIDFYLLQKCHFLFKNFSRFNEFCLFKGIPHHHLKIQNKAF